MVKVQFVNFVAFGKRNSIDLRVVVVYNYTTPQHYHYGGELPQNGSPTSIWAGFNELAQGLFDNLCMDLFNSGEAELVQVMISLKDECEAETYAESGCSSQELTFAMWISYFASLNETMINLADTPQE